MTNNPSSSKAYERPDQKCENALNRKSCALGHEWLYAFIIYIFALRRSGGQRVKSLGAPNGCSFIIFDLPDRPLNSELAFVIFGSFELGRDLTLLSVKHTASEGVFI